MAALLGAAQPTCWHGEALRGVIAAPGGYGIVACVGEGLVGYLVAARALDEAELLFIAVAQPNRKRGVAAAMLERWLLDSRQAGVLRWFLEVRESNIAARSLYAARGFRQVGRRRRYYEDPSEDALVLVREASTAALEA